MAGRGVHEAGAGVVGDMVAGKHGDVEFVAAAETFERMGKHKTSKLFGADVAESIQRHLGLGRGIFWPSAVGEDQLLARLRTKRVFGSCDFVEAVADTRRVADRSVTGDRPRGRRPDDDVRI